MIRFDIFRNRVKALFNPRWRVFFVLASFVVAVFLGLASAVLPWFLLVGLCLSVVYVLVLYKNPWVGIFLYLFAVLISPDLKLSDVLTFGSLAVVWFGLLAQNRFVGLPNSVRNPYFLFVGIVVVSFALAILYRHHSVQYVYRDGRIFLYWLWLPLIYSLLASERFAIKKCEMVFLSFALVVSIVALLQAATGVQFVAAGRVVALETGGVVDSSITRVQIPGYIFVSFSVLWVFVNVAYRRINILYGVALLAVFFAALYVNFGRALWAWSVIGLVISLLFMQRRRAITAAIYSIFLCIVGVAGLVLFKPAVIDSVVMRATSVQDEGKVKSSYGWRKLENELALKKIESSPVLGIGIGGEYRSWVPELRLFEEHTRYVHNSYIFMALKIGIPALVAIFWLVFIAWQSGRRFISEFSFGKGVQFKISSVSFTPAFLGLCITQPELMAELGVLFFVMVLMVLFVRPSEYKTESL